MEATQTHNTLIPKLYHRSVFSLKPFRDSAARLICVWLWVVSLPLASLSVYGDVNEVEFYSFNPGVIPSATNQFIQLEDGAGGRYARFFFDIRNGQFSLFTSGPAGQFFAPFTQFTPLTAHDPSNPSCGTLSSNALDPADNGRIRFNNSANGLVPGINFSVFQPDSSSPANGNDEVAIAFRWTDGNGDGLVDNGGLDVVEFLGAVYSPTQDNMIFDVEAIGEALDLGLGVCNPPPPPPPVPPAPAPQPPGPVIPQPEPVVLVTDHAAIAQLLGNGLPINQLLGQVASNVHNVSGRSLNQRIFRLRSRLEQDSYKRWFRERHASKLYNQDASLEVSNTIDLVGEVLRSHSPTNEGSSVDSSFADDPFAIFPSVVQQAGAESSGGYDHSGTLASWENWEVYASADFGRYDLDSLGGSPGIESNTYASTFGIEYVVSDSVAVGLGWSHVWNDNQLQNNAGSVDIEGDAVMAYASYFKNNIWGDLFYSYGSYEADLKRSALGSTLVASPKIDAHQSTLNIGYNLSPDSHIVHGPIFRADYNWGGIDGYTEQGNLRANTTFTQQDYRSFITTLGWQVNWRQDTSWGLLHPTFRLGYGRENLNHQSNVRGQLQNSPFALVSGNNFNRVGSFASSFERHDPGEGWLEVGAGVGVEFNSRLSLFFDYQGRYFQEDAQLHLGTVKASWKF